MGGKQTLHEGLLLIVGVAVAAKGTEQDGVKLIVGVGVGEAEILLVLILRILSASRGK